MFVEAACTGCITLACYATLVERADRVALLEDLQGVLGKCQQGQSRQLTQDLNYRRAGELPPVLLHPLQASDTTQSTDRQGKHAISSNQVKKSLAVHRIVASTAFRIAITLLQLP